MTSNTRVELLPPVYLDPNTAHVTTWLVADGDPVERMDVVAEAVDALGVESEVVAPAGGTVRQRHHSVSPDGLTRPLGWIVDNASDEVQPAPATGTNTVAYQLWHCDVTGLSTSDLPVGSRKSVLRAGALVAVVAEVFSRFPQFLVAAHQGQPGEERLPSPVVFSIRLRAPWIRHGLILLPDAGSLSAAGAAKAIEQHNAGAGSAPNDEISPVFDITLVDHAGACSFVPPRNIAALTVGAPVDEAVVVEDGAGYKSIAIRARMPVVLGYLADAGDAALASAFCSAVEQLLLTSHLARHD
ncbi:hypothetical protein ACIBM3_28130 [Rhodococcus erythropolis]|uniref:hypothetical protein n=1 Tax=Rhodococcus erythropolis TaxID=1833 RepID=UPI00379D73F9